LASSSKIKDSSRKKQVDEREESKRRRILEQCPDISESTLEFVLSLPVEQKIPKVSELETVHATPDQQEEMEKLLKKKIGALRNE
jgi:hypothetical protein